jgi:hypothetical protein
LAGCGTRAPGAFSRRLCGIWQHTKAAQQRGRWWPGCFQPLAAATDSCRRHGDTEPSADALARGSTARGRDGRHAAAAPFCSALPPLPWITLPQLVRVCTCRAPALCRRPQTRRRQPNPSHVQARMCICVNCKLVDICKAYHFVEEVSACTRGACVRGLVACLFLFA